VLYTPETQLKGGGLKGKKMFSSRGAGGEERPGAMAAKWDILYIGTSKR